MRTSTFLLICSGIATILVLSVQYLLQRLGFYPPYLDWIIFDFIKIAFFVPIVAFALNPLNKKLRDRRKIQGRDIDAEEMYETESGFLSLTEKDK